jgi:hypothetical protein
LTEAVKRVLLPHMAKRVCDPTSGKIGSQVYLIGRNGQVVRTRVIPSNPKSDAQNFTRASFAQASRSWDTIGQSAQLAWISAAAAHESRPRLGMSGPLTGNQFFVQVNANLIENGDTPTVVPPATPDFDTNVATALVATNPAGVGTLKISCSDDWPNNMRILAAAPVKNGVHRVPQLVDIGSPPAVANEVSNITALYTTRFGNPPTGSKVFVGVKQTLDGFDSVALTFSAIIPASS